MKKFYDSLCEKNKRRYAAIESEKLSHGGVNYISALLECDPKTIRQGKKNSPNRGVPTFAKAHFGRPSPSSRQKLNGTD
ncbi:hypothetical protein [Bathymodiolus platifrons methanotrophic gill symbiont]|uniref:hypothetical protein n=1 Tax=Bathymodiolus platifrons methanotrophic gill symbiont TaxID=113268 RepID=UPI001C8ED657|nr:hypothetical protein [Bathymodiolus platifrons methanotrophic gill symbiont]